MQVGVWSLLTTLCVSANVRAEQVRLKLLTEDRVTEGGKSEASFLIAVPSTGQASLVLSWQASKKLSAARSFARLTLDGRPLGRLVLRELKATGPERTARLPLGTLKAGQHLLSVETRLHIEGDPCLLEMHDDAWVRWIAAASYIEAPAPGQARAEATPLRDVQARWQARGVSHVWLDGAPRGRGLQPQATSTFVELVRLVHAWGFQPWLTPTPPASPAGRDPVVAQLSWRLLSYTAAEVDGLDQLLHEAPRESTGVARADGLKLLLRARDEAALTELAGRLRHQELIGQCASSDFCVLPRSPARPPETELSAESEGVVWQLRDSGYPRGWSAEGAGRHRLRFQWVRPASWQLKGLPAFTLRASRSASRQLDLAHSELMLKVNDQPVATWPLGGPTDSYFTTLPEALAAEPVWRFELTVWLHPKHEQACEKDLSGGLWFALSPRSQLELSRYEQRQQGLAEFWRRSQRAGVALWVEGAFSSDEALQLGTLVSALPAATEVQLSEGCEGPLCLHAVTPSQALRVGALAARQGQQPGLWWLDAAERLPLPAQPIGMSALMGVRESEAGLRLEFSPATYLPLNWAPPELALSEPAYARFAGGRWLSFDDPEVAIDARRVESETQLNEGQRVHSRKAERMLWMNLIWAACGLLLVGGMLWYWRKPRRTRRPVDPAALEHFRDKDGPQ